MSLPVLRFDYKNATDDQLRPAHEFFCLMEQERSPDDPPSPFEQLLAGIRNIPSFVDVHFFYVPLPDGRIGAIADIGILRTPENAHLAQLGIQVLPELRRQGIGSRLLHEVVAIAEREQRRLLMTNSNDRVPAGTHFLEKIGGKVGLESHTNQLRLSEINHSLLEHWLERGLPEGFSMGLWEGVYPEENIEEIVALNKLMNEVPHGDLDVEDFNFTAEHLREQEKAMLARGGQRWTLFIREDATGHIAGYTQLFWNPHRPTHAHQGITGVWPQYRGNGFGRYLKAAMIEKLLKERPEVVLIRTENADSNAPMLKINTELGFRPYRAEAVWQIDTTRARQYLTERGE